MSVSRVLLLSFVGLFTASTVQAQSIEIFVEPGVEIIGRPSNQNLNGVSHNAVGITNEGHVIFEGVGKPIGSTSTNLKYAKTQLASIDAACLIHRATNKQLRAESTFVSRRTQTTAVEISHEPSLNMHFLT